MKGKIVEVINQKDKEYMVIDTIVKAGDTFYLVRDEQCNVYSISAGDIMKVHEVQKLQEPLAATVLRYAIIAQAALPEIISRLEELVSKSNGLNHSIEHLREMKYKIAWLPIKEMATYADQICMQKVEAGELFEWRTKNEYFFPEFNATSIGNLAYIALYHENHEQTHAAMNVIEWYREWLKMNPEASTDDGKI